MNNAAASSSLRTAFTHCVQQVRNYDYHHYLCLLELPHNMRRAAFAIRALNVETARAMDVASDPRIGLMRLIWWQEAIDRIYANKSIEHPTAQALSAVLHENKISKGWLKRSVEARINDARKEIGDAPQKIEDLEKYAEDTMSTNLYMTLQAGGIRSTAADHAASHIGKASGLLLLIKSLPYHANRNRHFSYIPTEVAAKHGLLVKHGGQAEIRLDSREGMSEAVFEMASVANVHLQKARDLVGTVPVEARPVLLPAVPAQVLLDSLRHVNFDVFDPRLARGILGKYYLGDCGFPNRRQFLAPFRGTRYHLKDFCGGEGNHPVNAVELFNLRHAYLRNVIERIFGIFKSRFTIFKSAPPFPYKTQAELLACAGLHNFLRQECRSDEFPPEPEGEG